MKKLLIVDDDRSLLDSLRVVFNGLYDVHTVLSAEEALQCMEETTFDVILLDIILPGISGIDFLRVVRKMNSQIPVVMISGAASIRPVMQALDLGAADYVRKPFDIDELRLVVARSLRMQALQHQIEELQCELERRPVVAELGVKPLKEAVEEFERTLIEKALQSVGGIQTRAARVLGTTRRILRYRIDKLHISSSEDSV